MNEIEQLLTDEIGTPAGLDADWSSQVWVIGFRDDDDCKLVLAISDDESDDNCFSLVLRVFDIYDQAIDSRINYSARLRGVAALISEGMCIARQMGMKTKKEAT